MKTISKTNKAKNFPRRQMAAALTVIYLFVLLFPLVSLSIHSPSSAHAATGECSGDCNLCGCSLENRANKTCCCAQKLKQQQLQEHEAEKADTPDCCKKEATSRKPVITKCGCPCGSGKSVSISNYSVSEVIPSRFSEKICIPHVDTRYSTCVHRVASRYNEPPDPPPRQI
jgi:hypothetical protein